MGRGGGVVGLTENKATQPSLAGAWAELGKNGKKEKENNGGNNGRSYQFMNKTYITC